MNRVNVVLFTTLELILASALMLTADASPPPCNAFGTCTVTCNTGCTCTLCSSNPVTSLPAEAYSGPNCTGSVTPILSLLSPIIGNQLPSPPAGSVLSTPYFPPTNCAPLACNQSTGSCCSPSCSGACSTLNYADSCGNITCLANCTGGQFCSSGVCGCPTGLNFNGACCADGTGACCPSGVVDYCDVCNGSCTGANGAVNCNLSPNGEGQPQDCSGICGGTDQGCCPPSDSSCCQGGGGACGSTPFLFIFKEGKYYLENDVMMTYRNPYYELAKQGYEQNSGNPRFYKQTDYYKIRLNPDVTKEGINLLLREMEPEEDNIDQVRLVRVIHPKGSTTFVDEQTETIKTTSSMKSITLKTCTMNDGKDCTQALSAIDDQWIEGYKGQSFTATFDISNVDRNNLYLTIHSWQNDPPPLQPAPFKAKGSGYHGSLSIDIVDNTHPEKVLYSLKNLHPRKLALSDNIFDLKEAVKVVTGNTLTLKITWTEHHFVDYVGLIEARPAQMSTEELPLKKAVKSDGKDVLKELLTKDNVYVHLVRGEGIEMTFERPQKILKADEEDTYFFVPSGFYYGLRTYLYPHVDTSMDTFKKELKEYVHELEIDGMLKNQKP